MNRILRKIASLPIIIIIIIPIVGILKLINLICYPFSIIYKLTYQFHFSKKNKFIEWIYYSWITKEQEQEESRRAAIELMNRKNRR